MVLYQIKPRSWVFRVPVRVKSDFCPCARPGRTQTGVRPTSNSTAQFFCPSVQLNLGIDIYDDGSNKTQPLLLVYITLLYNIVNTLSLILEQLSKVQLYFTSKSALFSLILCTNNTRSNSLFVQFYLINFIPTLWLHFVAVQWSSGQMSPPGGLVRFFCFVFLMKRLPKSSHSCFVKLILTVNEFK